MDRIVSVLFIKCFLFILLNVLYYLKVWLMMSNMKQILYFISFLLLDCVAKTVLSDNNFGYKPLLSVFVTKGYTATNSYFLYIFILFIFLKLLDLAIDLRVRVKLTFIFLLFMWFNNDNNKKLFIKFERKITGKLWNWENFIQIVDHGESLITWFVLFFFLLFIPPWACFGHLARAYVDGGL